MHGDKVAGKTVTEPISQFRLYHCLTEETSVPECPRIIAAAKIDSPAWGNSKLDTKIGSGHHVAEKIGLYSEALGARRR